MDNTNGAPELRQLESLGKYVFHGSGEDIDFLEPRQAENFLGDVSEPDGEPAVFATTSADYAIFMALINEKNCPQGFHGSAGTADGKLSLSASKETLDQLTEEAYGWVYVFEKARFTERDPGGVEYVSREKETPLQKIRVTMADMPKYVTPFPSEE